MFVRLFWSVLQTHGHVYRLAMGRDRKTTAVYGPAEPVACSVSIGNVKLTCKFCELPILQWNFNITKSFDLRVARELRSKLRLK